LETNDGSQEKQLKIKACPASNLLDANSQEFASFFIVASFSSVFKVLWMTKASFYHVIPTKSSLSSTNFPSFLGRKQVDERKIDKMHIIPSKAYNL
jgi:hypothetical protein